MYTIYHNSLAEYNLSDIQQALEKDDDLLNTALILQLTEINLLQEIEDEKDRSDQDQISGAIVIEEADEAEDNLLNPSVDLDPKKKKRSSKDLRQEQTKQTERERVLGYIQEILESIKNRPQEFIGSNAADRINKKIGISLIPGTKEIRSAISTKILLKLANNKAKKLGLSDQISRLDAADRIKQYRKDRSISFQA